MDTAQTTPMHARTPQRRDGIIGAALVVFLGGWALAASPALRHLSYELPFWWRGSVATTNAVIVYMDEPSYRLLNQRFDQAWSRKLHAELIQRLFACGAQAVVFDVHFGAPGEPHEDAALIEAMTTHTNVIVAAYPTVETSERGPPVWKLSPPFAAMEKVAAWGVVEVTLIEDPTVRRHYAGVSGEPSLAWRVAERTMSQPPPREPSPTRWVNYYGPPHAIPHCSYWQVMSNTLAAPAATFSNQVVFVGTDIAIGYASGRPTEYFRTPYSGLSQSLAPGVEINATTYLNLRRGDWLREMPRAAQWSWMALCGAALGFGLARFRPLAAVGAGLSAALVLGLVASVWVWQTFMWTPWLIVAAVQVPVAVGWSLLAHTRDLVEKRAWQHPVALPPLPAPLFPAGPFSPPMPLPRPAEQTSSRPPVVPRGSGGAGIPDLPGAVLPVVPDHQLLRCIGAGAYGQVWLARDAIGSFHAVKIVHRLSFNSAGPYDREFRGIQKFTPISRSHPGFVNVLHVGRNEDAGYFYYVMEVGDDERTGQQIDPDQYSPKNLARELSVRGKLPADECVQLSLALAAALGHLHRNQLIHRDIKPSNIIFVHHIPKLADIGLVTDIAGTGREATYLGTEGYIAPEGPGTPAADVYSLGKVIYEAATGLDRRRFPDLPTALTEADGSPLLSQLNKVILRACERDPRRRYATAAALHAALLHLNAENPKRQRRLSPHGE